MMNKKVYMRIQKFKYLKFVPELNQTCPTDAPELTLFLNLVASKAFELFWTADPQWQLNSNDPSFLLGKVSSVDITKNLVKTIQQSRFTPRSKTCVAKICAVYWCVITRSTWLWVKKSCHLGKLKKLNRWVETTKTGEVKKPDTVFLISL